MAWIRPLVTTPEMNPPSPSRLYGTIPIPNSLQHSDTEHPFNMSPNRLDKPMLAYECKFGELDVWKTMLVFFFINSCKVSQGGD